MDSRLKAGSAAPAPPRQPATIGTRALLVLLVMLAVLPGVAVVVYGYLAAQREAIVQMRRELRSVGELAAANQASVLAGVQQILATVASGPSVRRDDLRGLCRDFLRNIVAASPGYANIGVADLQGDVVCQGHAANAPLNVSERRFFQRALAQQRFAVGGHAVGRVVSGQRLIGFGIPVYSDGGALSGVAYAVMDLDLASRQLRQVSLPAQWQVHLFDYRDTVLVSSGEGSLPIGAALQDATLRALVRRPGAEVVERRDAAGEVWLDHVSGIAGDADSALRLVVSVRRAEALGPATARLRLQLGALALATLLGMGMAGWLSERQFARPVSRLLRRMQGAIEPAEADAPGVVTANRELMALDAGFSRTLQQLRGQQEQLQRAQALARVGFYRLDVASGRYTVSPIVYEMLGLDPAQEYITLAEYTAMIHPDDRPLVLARRAGLMHDLQPLRLQFRIVRPDGEQRHVDIFGYIDAAHEGRALSYSGAIQDITEGQRLRRLLDVQSELNAAIVGTADLATLYQEACRIVVHTGQMRMAWVASVDAAGQFEPQVHAGHEAGYVDFVLQALRERGCETVPLSPAQMALRNGRVEPCNDIAADPRMARWQAAAAERGYRATAAVPLKDGGRVVAALMFMAAERHFFQPEQMRVLEAIGERLSLAIGRLRTEASMRALNRRMTDLLASTSDGFVAFDRDWRYTHANAQAARFAGLAPEALVGRTYHEVFPDAVGSASDLAFRAVMAGRQPLSFETCYEPWGRWFENRVFPTDEGISVFFQDITERKQAAVRAQAQMSRMQLLGAITRAIEERMDLQGVLQVLADSLHARLPAALCAVALRAPGGGDAVRLACVGVGGEARAASGELVAGTRLPVQANGLARCLRGELVYEAELAGLDFELPRRLLACGLHSAVLVPLALEGEAFGVIVVARAEAQGFSSGDCEFLHQLSEHVALAANQARLYEDLQQAYERLQRSQQGVLQQERLRALGQMASGVAHDINNAVSPVALYTEALLDSEPGLSERTRRYLQTIQRAIDDVTHTVARMREFSRGRDPAAGLVPVQLNTLVPQVLELTRARWRDMPQQAGVVVEVASELQAGLPEVLATEGELREALTNLVFNAVDAMPQGGRLLLSTRQRQLAGRPAEVEVAVGDSGLGMDEVTRRRCLEPFYTTKGERGTGLGLAMVYGTVQRHGGSIEIDSAPGQGTTVRLVFPVQPGPGVAVALPPPLPAAAPPLALLLVDDDAMLLESLGEILRSEGHAVDTALGGQAGLDALQAAAQQGRRYDVVITDLGMPHVDGSQVARAAKALHAQLPVVLLTGWGRRMSEDDERPEHVDLLLSKPPRLAELREMARRFALPAGGR